ncbi:TcpQ domain-containing protein [Achromobacter aloeverae]
MPDATYDFNWRLSGERAVAPLQVFDDGRRTWLHFAPGQALPAIFAVGREGERPVPYLRRDPYVVIEGVWPALIMRGGRLRAVARRHVATRFDEAAASGARAFDAMASDATALDRRASDTAIPGAAASGAIASGTAASDTAFSGSSVSTGALSGPTVQAAASPGAATASPRTAMASAGRPRHETNATSRSARAAGQGAARDAAVRSGMSTTFSADLADGNLRRVLARWAGLAGWTFGPEHWDVDVDIPLAGSAGFGDDFKHAVRALVGATEMAERPLQPCFYANRVLRVVPLAQACDRAAPRESMT